MQTAVYKLRYFVSTGVWLVLLFLSAFVAVTIATDHFQAQAIVPNVEHQTSASNHKKNKSKKKSAHKAKPAVVSLASLSVEDRQRYYPSARVTNESNFDLDVTYLDKAAPRSWSSQLSKAQRVWNKPLNCPAGVKLHTLTPGASSMKLYAVAAKDTCIIWISRLNFRRGYRPTPRERCIVLAHELGHIYGRKHRKGTLMNAVLLPSIRVPACGDPRYKKDNRRVNPQAFVG